MKKSIFIMVFLLLVTAFLLTPLIGDQLFAVSGCCKERKTYKGRWYPNGRSYSECKQQNETDGDDVFEESGLVWWDVKCR